MSTVSRTTRFPLYLVCFLEVVPSGFSTMELREAYVELMIELEEIRLKEKYGK